MMWSHISNHRIYRIALEGDVSLATKYSRSHSANNRRRDNNVAHLRRVECFPA